MFEFNFWLLWRWLSLFFFVLLFLARYFCFLSFFFVVVVVEIVDYLYEWMCVCMCVCCAMFWLVSVLIVFFRFRCCLLREKLCGLCVGFFSPFRKCYCCCCCCWGFYEMKREKKASHLKNMPSKLSRYKRNKKILSKQINRSNFFRLAMPAWMKETHRNDRSTNIFVQKISTGKFVLCFICVCVWEGISFHYYVFCAWVNDDLIQWNE